MLKHRLLPICHLFLCGVTVVEAHDSTAAHTHPPATNVAASDGEIIGHGFAKYRVVLNWAKANPAVAPVINSHALSEGRVWLIDLVTDHPRNAFLVFQKDGTFVNTAVPCPHVWPNHQLDRNQRAQNCGGDPGGR